MFVNNTEELAQNKLLLLYIINVSTYPLNNEELTEFVLKKDYMNYFVIQQYLLELFEAGFIKYENSGDEKIYKILDKGKTTLSYFQNRLPLSIRKEISAEFLQAQEDEKIAAEVISDYYKKANSQYIVSLKLIENTETLFSLKINVPTIKQAEKISNMWKNNPELIYTGVLNLLLDENFSLSEK